MKRTQRIKPVGMLIIAGFLLMIIVGGCRSSRQIPFAGHQWKVNDSTKYIHDKDLSWVFTMDDILFSETDNPVMGDEIRISRFEGLRNYLDKQLECVRLNVDSIIMYLPTYKTLFVTYDDDDYRLVPSAITHLTMENSPTIHNMFMQKDYKADASEILMNVFYNRKQKSYVIVCRFSYGDRRVAMIKIMQSYSEKLRKYSHDLFGDHYYSALTSTEVDYTDRENAFLVGWGVRSAINLVKKNYDLGQRLKELKSRRNRM